MRTADLHLTSRPPPGDAAVTVVVPARSSTRQVSRLLAAVPEGVPVVIVDDGSQPPLSPAARPGLRVLRHAAPRGPAAARNAGAREVTTPWVAFVDSDVVPGPGWLDAMLEHARAPGVLAVAPRVVSAPTGGLAGLVETWSGGLDLGAKASDVGLGQRVSFVPTALLVVERDAFDEVGGFDESMHVGEDVDLVRRLEARGRVRYEPDVVAVHEPRTSFRAVLARRFAYGLSTADLDRRRPGSVRHAEVSIWSLAPWLLAVLVHPAAGVAAGALTVAISPYGLRDLSPADARRLAAHGHLLSACGLGRYLVRPLWPVTALAFLLAPRRRGVLAGAVAVGAADAVARRVRAETATRSAPAAAKALIAMILDDVAYSAGVWAGCIRQGTIGPLLPKVTELPVRRPAWLGWSLRSHRP